MTEYSTRTITCPADVDAFEQESQERHQAAGLALYVDDDAPPEFEATREEFLRNAQERAQREEFEIRTATRSLTIGTPARPSWNAGSPPPMKRMVHLKKLPSRRQRSGQG